MTGSTTKDMGTREQIVRAAHDLIREQGLTAATTKAIAARARCAEGSIYRYFPDKHALFVECVRSRFPGFLELLGSLPDRAGTETVRRHLEELGRAALAFCRAIIPMVSGAIADRDLLEQQRRHFAETRTGPLHVFSALTSYVKREQRLGRLSNRPSAEHVSRLLLGACFAQAYLDVLLGDDARPASDEHFVKETVRSLMEPLAPARKAAT